MKKMLSLVLALTLMLSVSACGTQTAATTTAAATAATAATTAAATAATTAAATAATTAGTTTSKLIRVGFAQVGHESDWRTASTNSVQAAFTKEKGFDLSFVDCNNDSAAQIAAIRQFIQQGFDYI